MYIRVLTRESYNIIFTCLACILGIFLSIVPPNLTVDGFLFTQEEIEVDLWGGTGGCASMSGWDRP